MGREMTKLWRNRRNCRTCRFASATDKERSYTPGFVHRCLYPTNQLPWPALPHSLTGANGVANILDNIKSGRAKKPVNIRDSGEGESCPMWEEWKVAK
jgi:hypothetical protein